MNDPDRSPAVTRAARASAGTLLLLERQANRELNDAVGDAAARAAAEAAMHEREHLTEAAIAVILLAGSRRLAAELTERLRRARARARAKAAERLAAELRAGGLRASATRVAAAAAGHADEVRLATSADSLALQWRQRTLLAARTAARQETPAIRALAASDDAMASAAGRTATTETAQAYEDGRRESGEGLVDSGPYRAGVGGLDGDVPGVIALDMWDAILDSRTCPECAALNGETAAVGQPFPQLMEPGYVHPRCRCIRTLIFQYRGGGYSQ